MFDVSKSKLRDAARLALQSAFAASATFLIMESASMPEKFVAIISAVLVVQPSSGGTLHAGKDRFFATVAGFIIGLVCLLILPGGYGTAAALAFSLFAMSVFTAFRPEWRYGVVAAVALSLGSESDAMQTAFDRTIGIGLGVTVGSLAAFIIWRDSAEKRSVRHINEALQAVCAFLENAFRTAQGEDGSTDNARADYASSISKAREAVAAIRLRDNNPFSGLLNATDQIWVCAQYLDLIGEEENPASADGLSKPSKIVREEAQAVLRSLAAGEPLDETRLGKIRDATERARTGAQSDNDDRALEHAAKGAMAFTLGEIGDALEALSTKLEQARSAI